LTTLPVIAEIQGVGGVIWHKGCKDEKHTNSRNNFSELLFILLRLPLEKYFMFFHAIFRYPLGTSVLPESWGINLGLT